ncbi:hypothetical protein MAR_033373 [Mya arenaria]|uniref:Uncharacterized protein n=1 Tax=Mya arenaria TaxID=6604 RepID=A0ABY7GCL6_MYAAR|nr:hypothetical protein MAR_033373 [Mya arenaria]
MGAMADNFYRLVTFLIDTTTPILQDLFEDCAIKDTTTNQNFTTLQQYLFNKEQDVRTLLSKEKWKYKQIYPKGKPSSSLDVTDSANLDVSVLSSLLLGLYGGLNPPLLAPTTSMDIKQITAIRNSKFLAHGCSTTIQSVDFETLWNQLKKATISIARLRSNNSYTTATEEKIKKTLISNMPGMWNSCAKWFTSVVEEQADTIQSMRTFLETGTEVLSSPSANFKTLLYNNRPVHSDQLSTMTELIRSKLINNIPVVITGVERALYEEVALTAIRQMPNFNEEFCVTINDPHEWRELEEHFVNVVVFKDPFGLDTLDKSNTKAMNTIFQSIAIRSQNGFSTVILTKKSVLKEALLIVSQEGSEMFSDENIFEPAGTEWYPIDMEAPIRGTHKRVQPLGQTLKNMLGDEPKVVSSYVASLATRDEGKNALVLKRTADLRYVEVGVVNVLIVEHFAGKHALNKVKARQWLEELDMLKALSQQRNTCVILSSTNAVFKEAMKTKIGKTLTRHPLLANVVDISKSIIHQIVKEEISSDNGEADPLPLEESSDSMAIEENQPTPKKRHGIRKSFKESAIRQVNPNNIEINPTSDTDKRRGLIKRMCLIENDLLLIDPGNTNLKIITHSHEAAIVKELVIFDDEPSWLATLPLKDECDSYTVAVGFISFIKLFKLTKSEEYKVEYTGDIKTDSKILDMVDFNGQLVVGLSKNFSRTDDYSKLEVIALSGEVVKKFPPSISGTPVFEYPKFVTRDSQHSKLIVFDVRKRQMITLSYVNGAVLTIIPYQELFSKIHDIGRPVSTENEVADGEGGEAHMVFWQHPGSDVTGMVGRCEKVAGTCDKLLEGEVYHYHTKLMKKPAKIGGKHIWHQDYGQLVSQHDDCVHSCRQMHERKQLPAGSHKCGRIEHVKIAAQQGADMDRVEEIRKHCPLEYIEMEPGDALFFHCNLLHCSSANTSGKRRWALRCAYNRADNDPIWDHHNPHYTKLEKNFSIRNSEQLRKVAEIRKHCPLEYVEMEPGDALFFHCNLLHCSSANTSGNRRWAFLCAYNRADNDPIKDHHHPHYTKLEKVPNSAVLECTNLTDMTGKQFYGENLENIPGRRKIPRDEQ